jgi:hypothetical protein
MCACISGYLRLGISAWLAAFSRFAYSQALRLTTPIALGRIRAWPVWLRNTWSFPCRAGHELQIGSNNGVGGCLCAVSYFPIDHLRISNGSVIGIGPAGPAVGGPDANISRAPPEECPAPWEASAACLGSEDTVSVPGVTASAADGVG